MKNITLWQRLRRVNISTSLHCAFPMGALLILTVSSVSLYSWHEQGSQIRHPLDKYFPPCSLCLPYRREPESDGRLAK